MPKFNHGFGVLFFVTLAFVGQANLRAQNVQEPVWNWGSDGNEICEFTEPKGLLGCKWFNYDNGWAKRAIIFENWAEKHNNQGLCFHGSFAAMMLYYRWPEKLRLNGLADQTVQEIDHTWDYNAIADFTDCENDNPAKRLLSSCPQGQMCTVADEIARMTMATRMASNYWDEDYHPAFAPLNKMPNVMKTRLGFLNVKWIMADAPGAKDTIISRLTGTATGGVRHPVIAFNDGHLWIVDDYRRGAGGVDDFHYLTYRNNCNHHTAHWTAITDYSHTPEAYIYDIDPTVQLREDKPYQDSLFFGSEQLMFTEGTKREGIFRLVSVAGQGTVHLKISSALKTGGTWQYRGPVWEGDVELGPEGFATPAFHYEGPETGASALVVNLSVPKGSPGLDVRGILDDRMLYTTPKFNPSKIFAWNASENEDNEKTEKNNKPLKLISPTIDYQAVPIGSLLDIEWIADPTVVSDVVAYVSADYGKTWLLITLGSSVSAKAGKFLWKIPKVMSGKKGPISLDDVDIFIRISSYGDADAWDVTPKPIKVLAKTTAISYRPSSRRVVARAESMVNVTGQYCLPYKPSARHIGMQKLYAHPKDDCFNQEIGTAMK